MIEASIQEFLKGLPQETSDLKGIFEQALKLLESNHLHLIRKPSNPTSKLAQKIRQASLPDSVPKPSGTEEATLAHLYIPVESGHRFRFIPATFRVGLESEAALDNLKFRVGLESEAALDNLKVDCRKVTISMSQCSMRTGIIIVADHAPI